VVEGLLCKCEALSSNPTSTKTKQTKNKKPGLSLWAPVGAVNSLHQFMGLSTSTSLGRKSNARKVSASTSLVTLAQTYLSVPHLTFY
jgi:hypothetical protein